MKALIMQKDRTIQYGDIAAPTLGEADVLIRVAACGICGTDMHVWKGMECAWSLPGVIGHEFAGTIMAVGAAVDGLKVGERVTVQPLVSCGVCPRCLEGRSNLCENIYLIGGERPGAFAELVAVPAENVIKLPPDLPLKYGALAEPAATAVHAVKRLKKDWYETVVIKGAGAIGLLILTAVRERAGKIMISDIADSRLATAQELGADITVNPRKESLKERIYQATTGKMADVVFDAAGEPGGKNQIMELVHAGAELVFAALGNGVAEWDFTQVITRELSVYGTQCHTKEDFVAALHLMGQGKISYEKIVTEMPLNEGEYAFGNPGIGIKIHLFP